MDEKMEEIEEMKNVKILKRKKEIGYYKKKMMGI